MCCKYKMSTRKSRRSSKFPTLRDLFLETPHRRVPAESPAPTIRDLFIPSRRPEERAISAEIVSPIAISYAKRRLVILNTPENKRNIWKLVSDISGHANETFIDLILQTAEGFNVEPPTVKKLHLNATVRLIPAKFLLEIHSLVKALGNAAR